MKNLNTLPSSTSFSNSVDFLFLTIEGYYNLFTFANFKSSSISFVNSNFFKCEKILEMYHCFMFC